ncbi:hypothetical protein [Streptomyces parvus]|uniref:hypothetical protein n=1 Tax=Streptomyces parvus TaxID=66428 RepID=UPI0033C41432
MRTALAARTSTGYGSRERGGFHGELDVETALGAAVTAARLRDAAAAGEKISGPAARRAIVGAASIPSFEGALTTPKAAAKFLARDGLVPFDNPDAFLICAFKRDTALCDPDPRSDGAESVRLPTRLRQRDPDRQPRPGRAGAR